MCKSGVLQFSLRMAQTKSTSGDGSLLASRNTRYSLVAHALLEDIRGGRYPVGEMLPTEAALQQRFGVGRHTVREAIRQLRNIGVVTARAGIGTTVTATSASRHYVQSMNSVAELLHFTKSTRLKRLAEGEVIADAALAPTLKCGVGHAWYHIELLRTSPGLKEPLALVQVYVRPEFGGIAEDVEDARTSVFSQIERRYGVHLFELQQEISATHLSAREARILKTKPGSAALKILRHYYDADQRITQVSMGVYPEGRFSYTSRLRLNVQT
jgi:GntR family transcriptional regulator